VFGMVKTTIWCERGCQNHIFSGTLIFSILGSILVVFLIENGTKVDMWLTLGVPGAPTGGIGSRSRFCRFLMIFRGPHELREYSQMGGTPLSGGLW
jgi:hypothetical protein